MVSFKAIEGKLKPCPFCGGEAYEDSCDILINIGCNKCGYHMAFKGLLRPKEEHPDRPIASVDGKIIYYKEAYEDAIKKWNTREADK